MQRINETHDPALRSWVESANSPDADFPLQNLPFGVFRRHGSDEPFRGGVAIGDQILDLAAAQKVGAFAEDAAAAATACGQSTLNAFMALGPDAWSALRLTLSRTLRLGAPEASALGSCLVPQSEAEYAVPAQIGDYTDFYTSIHHATNVGRLFRPDNPLLPNYKWVPIGYHGRASTIGVSGQTFPRPVGQTMAPGSQTPDFGPSKRLDYELEVGVFVGVGNNQGERITLQEAERHVFGLCLLNDWSARDIQAWEYQPLGPFLSKNFASTISPWIVTLEALAPYRLAWTRAEGDPQPLAYLDSLDTRERGAIDIQLEVALETEAMGRERHPAARLACTSFKHSYWTVSQMVTHHTVNGCGLKPGDLLGSGTESGPTPEEAGSLLELTVGGKQPVQLPNGETRSFLEDGDTVILRAWCEKPGAARIGFGECRSTVLPAIPW
jgi:fumarylacetoacetase